MFYDSEYGEPIDQSIATWRAQGMQSVQARTER